ncbi:MAG: hypothetical protein FRC54_08710 [bacterium LCO1.1]|uniref:Uncharacterized protein n=1 Tax=Candidatus Weimeria bifida TaxID=2599074 RepID=A0A6N7J042_9FIRM|nr:hypothetical protein [Candidatus Weimeria bifida]
MQVERALWPRSLRGDGRKASGGRVSNAWITCHILRDNSWKQLLIPHKTVGPHGPAAKAPAVYDGSASD